MSGFGVFLIIVGVCIVMWIIANSISSSIENSRIREKQEKYERSLRGFDRAKEVKVILSPQSSPVEYRYKLWFYNDILKVYPATYRNHEILGFYEEIPRSNIISWHTSVYSAKKFFSTSSYSFTSENDDIPRCIILEYIEKREKKEIYFTKESKAAFEALLPGYR